jgi:hypothetical protein
MQKTDYVIGSKAMFCAVYSLDLEGIIAKRRADPYSLKSEVVQDSQPGLFPKGQSYTQSGNPAPRRKRGIWR